MAAITRVKVYINNNIAPNRKQRTVYLILTSLIQISFAELSSSRILWSEALPLIFNAAPKDCSPGFRVLASVLTSCCWKKSFADRERWGIPLPPEMLGMVLEALSPRDAISFARASFAVERCYYSSIPHLVVLKIARFVLSIPCCRLPDSIEKDGVYCRLCYTWKHARCLGIDELPPHRQYICSICESEQLYAKLDAGGIFKEVRANDRSTACLVLDAGIPKALFLRIIKPSFFLRDGRDLQSRLRWLVDYTVDFGTSFSGLEYGLEDGR